MNVWKNEILRVINQVLSNSGQATDVEVTVCLFAAIFAAVIALKNTGKVMGFSMPEHSKATVIIGLALILSLAAVTAENIYALPHIKNAFVAKWLPSASCMLILLAIIAPITCLTFKSGYFRSLFAILVSIAAAVGIVILVHSVFGMLKQGDKEFKKTKARTESVNDFLSK